MTDDEIVHSLGPDERSLCGRRRNAKIIMTLADSRITCPECREVLSRINERATEKERQRMMKKYEIPSADPHDWKRSSERLRRCAACGREEIHIAGRPKEYSGGVGYAPMLKSFPGACVDTTTWEGTEKELPNG